MTNNAGQRACSLNSWYNKADQYSPYLLEGESMRLIKLLSSVLIVLAVFSRIIAEPASAENVTPPKNIILFIGDGMGVGHISAAKIEKETLNLEQFKVLGLLSTQAIDSLITDSPAATTALATGVNTLVGAIGVTPEGDPLKNVLEYSKDRGKGTGLIATSNVTDGTPACFVAHVSSRHMYAEIADAIAELKIDVIMGGGWGYFIPKNHEGSLRQDARDLLSELSQTHEMVMTPQQFRALGKPRRLIALLAQENLPPASLRPVPLIEMTQKAIEALSQYENGFFLVVEGSQIDWASHHGNGEQLIEEVIDLDEAVGAALEFAKTDQQTLVLVVSDHETGGYTILNGSVKKKKVTQASFFTEGHSAAMVPLFAYGPGSEAFAGIHDLAFVGQTLISYLQNP